jgi:hypothetical protein
MNMSTYNGKPIQLATYHGMNNQKILYVIPLKGAIINGLLCMEVTTKFIGVLSDKDVRIQPGRMLVNPKAVPPPLQGVGFQVQPTQSGYSLTIRQDKNLLVTNAPRPAVVPIPGIQKPPTQGDTGGGTGPGTGGGTDPGTANLWMFKPPYKQTSVLRSSDPGCDAVGTADQNGQLLSKTKALLSIPSPQSVRGEAKPMVAISWTAPKTGTATISATFLNIHCNCLCVGIGGHLPALENDLTDVGSIYLEVRSNRGGSPKKQEQELLRWNPGRMTPEAMTMQDAQRVLQVSLPVQQGEILTLMAAANHYSRSKNKGGLAQGETRATIQEIKVQMPDR